MHFAARMGHTAVVEKLVALGGDVHTKQQLGATPLHYAAIEGNTVTCQKLLKLGADVSATNDSGSSAIALAEREATEVEGWSPTRNKTRHATLGLGRGRSRRLGVSTLTEGLREGQQRGGRGVIYIVKHDHSG
ncbi:ankyrin repeat-containing domain protein [Baffinella frigidus]|nr:ankyrin repeat-containing domain protein [Cryptophyta sp. CCMP2293]